MIARLVLVAAVLAPLAVSAQDFPARALRIVVPNPPGGGNDFIGRLLADKLRDKWGQPAVVENRAGASGSIGADVVAKAAPDGYTLLVTPPASLTLNRHLFAKLAYDPDAFAPVSLVAASPGALLAHPAVRASGTAELIALARAEPGRVTFASQGNATIAHLAGELFASITGTRLVHVPYKGSAPALADLLGGQVQVMFGELSAALAHVRAGKLRLLATGGERRDPLTPDTPTIAETVPGFTFAFWFAMVAPPGTPGAITERLAAAIAESFAQPDTARRLAEAGLAPIAGSPAALGPFLKRESARWGAVIRAVGIRGD